MRAGRSPRTSSPSPLSIPRAASEQRSDVLTIAAIAVIVYAVSSVLHEGIGHALTCMAVGGRLQELSSMHVSCSIDDTDRAASRLVSAAGTIATLIGAASGAIALRATPTVRPILKYAFWLFMTVNLFQGTGYWLFSGLGNIGDWAAVIRGLEPRLAWRAVLAIVGAVTYWLSVKFAFGELGPFIGGDIPARYERAVRLSLVPYLVGAALSVGAGMLNRSGGLLLVVISGAAASLGGTSGLAWGTNYLRGAAIPASPVGPIALPRSIPAIVAAIIVGIAFAIVLGPGLRF